MTMPADVPKYDPRDHPGHIRATDDDREAVSAMVRRALDDGRLRLDEVDERIGAVYQAKTHGDLVQVVDDIVPYHPPRLVAPPPVAPPPGVVPTSNKKILPAVVLTIPPFGMLGAHRFYTGHTNTGIAMLVLTVIGIGAPITFLWWMVDLVRLCLGNFRDVNGHQLRNW